MKMANNAMTMRKILSAAVLAAVVLTVGFAEAAAAPEQYRYGQNRYRVQWDKNRTRDFATIMGYHNGYAEGRQLQSRGYRGNYKDMAGYRNDMNGWLSFMSHESTYRSYYRKGFEQGFKDAQSGKVRRWGRNDLERMLGDSLDNVYGRGRYQHDDDWRRGPGFPGRNDRFPGRDDRFPGRNDRYDRNQVLRVAQQNGYQAGFRHGREDSARRRSHSVERDRDYRDALRGYRSEFGDRELYRRAYRDAYRRGYDDGYRNRPGWNPGRSPWPF